MTGAREVLTEAFRQVRIEFDEYQAVAHVREPSGQDSAARADLDEGVARFDSDCIDDPSDDRQVTKKVLAERLAWNRPCTPVSTGRPGSAQLERLEPG